MKIFLKYLLESFLVIIVLPYIAVSLSTSYTGLGIALVLFMVILPIYFIFSPLRFDTKTLILWLLPVYNALLFVISVRLTFNNSADTYLLAYLPLSYIVILIKFATKKLK